MHRFPRPSNNYFFVKAVEKLNEGGILAFVTSRGIADTQANQFVRDYLVHRCNLITALRLPDNLFMQTSGIEVGSDLLIFQKDSRKTTLADRERLFMETVQEVVPCSDQYTGHTNKLFTLPKPPCLQKVAYKPTNMGICAQIPLAGRGSRFATNPFLHAESRL